LFTETHEWVEDEGDNVVRIGISQYAQDQLGEIVYCDMPPTGAAIQKNQTLCTLESVKAVGEVYCPVEGEVVESNPVLASEPHLVNQHPDDQGWLVRMKYEGSFSDISKRWKDAVVYKDYVDSLKDGH
jgi:glycine cleavage system H protein